jgi:WD40 repeat protein/serine/threonine protein kinase
MKPSDTNSGPVERQLFSQALERPAGEERATFLDRACADNPDLRRRLEELLQKYEALGTFLEAPAISAPYSVNTASEASAPIAEPAGPREKAGDHIGRYKLLQKIGEGGCGVVYLAEQEEPVRRKVALKVIKLGMDTREVVARFEAERQALALMNHPNIAKVFDAGTTDPGRPYFVMELVRGLRITDYCDQTRLSTRHRLDLFIKVCKAVQHAHQKGVIHRDLKPSNILITINDGVPVPKIIDFGIAKATSGQPLTEKTLWTRFEQLIGTPAYMSPEQGDIGGQDIDTRSDIYSLGVLLYELLTGRTPFDSKELLACGMDGMRRIIREREPVRPSTMAIQAITESGVDKEGIVSRRGSGPVKELIRLLQGDLDWIVMKCLEKDRSRRYETANGLAMDLERLLNNEAVIARPPSHLYRFQKLVRRNNLTFGAVAAVTAALVFGIVASSWQAARATKARAEAKQLLYVADIDLAHRALEDGNIIRAEGLLGSHSPEPGQEDLRGFEWYALKRLCRGDQLFSFPTQAYTPLCVAFSSDGKLLATGNGNCDPDSGSPPPANSLGELKLFDLATKSEVIKFPQQSACVTAIAFSHDDQILASGHDDGTIVLWNLNGQRTATLPTSHRSRIIGLHFSPRERALASASHDGTVTFWNAEFGREEWTIDVIGGPGEFVATLAFAPDGSRLAVAGSGPITLIDIGTTNRLVIPWSNIYGTYINGLAFSPNGKTLAIANNNDWVQLLDLVSLPTNRPSVTTLGQHLANANSVAFVPDGTKLVSAGGDSTLNIWDVALHKEIGALRGHRAAVLQIAISPDGKTVASVSEDKTVKLWWPEPQPEFDVLTNGNWVWTADFSGDGTRLVTGSWDTNGSIRLWDVASRLCVRTFLGHTGGVMRALFSKDNKLVISCGVDQLIKIWDAKKLGTQPLAILQGHQGTVSCLCLSPDGRTLASASGYAEDIAEEPHPGVVKLWDLSKLSNIATFKAHETGIYSMAFSPDGLVLATGSEDTNVKLWDMHQTLLAELPGYTKVVQGLVFLKDGKVLVSTDQSGELIFWDVARRAKLARERLVSGVGGLALSTDGRTLIEACGNGTVRLRNVLTQRELLTVSGQRSWGQTPAISHDGRVLAVPNADGTVLLWPAGRFCDN